MRRRKRKIIPRRRWKARPPRSASPMSSDRHGMFVHHTVSKAPRTKWGERREMRNLQRIAWAKGYADISYSFIVFPSGRIYEGRGVGIEGAHTYGFNSSAYGVAAAGNYETRRPTEKMVRSFRWLRRRLGVANKPVQPHSAVFGTACPGRYLRARIREM